METLFKIVDETQKDASGKKVFSLKDNSYAVFNGIEHKINHDAVSGIKRFSEMLKEANVSEATIASLTVSNLVETSSMLQDAKALFTTFRSSCAKSRPPTIALQELIATISASTIIKAASEAKVSEPESVTEIQSAPVANCNEETKTAIMESKVERPASKVLAERLGLNDHILEAVSLAKVIKAEGASYNSVALAVCRSNPEEVTILHLAGKTDSGSRKTLSSFKRLEDDAIKVIEDSAKQKYPGAKMR